MNEEWLQFLLESMSLVYFEGSEYIIKQRKISTPHMWLSSFGHIRIGQDQWQDVYMGITHQKITSPKIYV